AVVETPPADAVPTTAPAPPPIALADLNAQIELSNERIEAIGAQLTPQLLYPPLVTDLEPLVREINWRFAETRRLVNAQASLEIYNTLENNWQTILRTLAGWQADVTRRAAQLDGYVQELNELGPRWQGILEQATASASPVEVTQRLQ